MAARKITSESYRPWNTPELLLLATYPTAVPAELLALLPGRTWGAIHNAANRLGYRRLFKRNNGRWTHHGWSDADVETLTSQYATMGGSALVPILGRSAGRIRGKASTLGLRYTPQGPKPRDRRGRAYSPRTTPHKRDVRPATGPAEATPRPVRRAPGTPVLNAKKAEMKAREIKRALAPITAEAIRAMRYDNPQRRAYMLDGVRGWQVYMQGIAA